MKGQHITVATAFSLLSVVAHMSRWWLNTARSKRRVYHESEINQIALHQLIKRDEQTLEVVLRDSLLEPTATVVEMMAELHRVYSAKIKPMVCSATRVNWLIACACNAG